MKVVISIIVPVFNEDGNIIELNKRLLKVLFKINQPAEIIYVDDGSTDQSWSIICQLHKKDDFIKGIKFFRNFGHQNALKSGLAHACGEAVITIDADLQHPPEIIVDMYHKWKEGYRIVQAIRKDNESIGLLKRFFSKLFYKVLNFLSDLDTKPGSSDYRLIDKSIVNQINNLNESQFFLRGIINWVGCKYAVIEYPLQKRHSGSSKYSVKKMINLATDGIMSFSIKPLRLSIFIGTMVTFSAFIYLVYVIVIRLTTQEFDVGWASILGSVLLLGGVQLICLGIIGEYLGRVYLESKKRNNYLIEETTF